MVGVFQLSEPLNNDVGITRIDAPSDGVLTDTESISVVLRNFGSTTQSNFPVSYTINNGVTITETYTETLSLGESAIYTFTTTSDLSITNQTYTITAATGLALDENESNNSSTTEILNAITFCMPTARGGCFVDGIKRLILGSIDIDDGNNGCNSTGSVIGYVDRRFLSTDLNINGEHTLSLQTNFIPQDFSLWIDFDDSGSFETSEQLIIGEAFTTVNNLENFTLNIPTNAQLGSHVLRIKSIDSSANGDINDPCSDVDFGETHDYTVNITDSTLSTNSLPTSDSSLIVSTLSNNQYFFNLTTTLTGTLSFRVYDLQGKIIVFNNLTKQNGEYNYTLDMSHAASGVYYIKMGSKNIFENYKVVVK